MHDLVKAAWKDVLWKLTAVILTLVLNIGLLQIFVVRPLKVAPVPISIKSESTVTDYQTGGEALLVEYYVGGIATSAVFRPHEMHLYVALIEHLKESGRLSYMVQGTKIDVEK